jgi:hypothetical protein
MGMCVDDAPLLRFTPLRDGTLRCAAASRPLPALLWAPLVGPRRVTHAARRAVAFTHCSALFARSHAGAGMAQLIHSKATMGHGKCGTAEEVQRIIDQTQAAIDSK